MTTDQPSPKRGWRDVAADDHSHIQTRASEAAERFAAKRSERRALSTVAQGNSSLLDSKIIENDENNSWRTSSSRDQLYHQEVESHESHSNDVTHDQETHEEDDKKWRDFTLTDDAVRIREEERRTKMEAKAAQRKKRADKAKRDWSKRKTQTRKHDDSRNQDRDTEPRRSRRSKVTSPQSHRRKVPSATRSPTSRSSQQSSSDIHHSSASSQEQERTHTQERSSQKKKRAKPPIDAAWVKRSGMYYLGRFNASEAHFRSVLMTKIKRAESRVSDDPQEHIQWVDAAVKEGKLFGALNDEHLALGLARSYRRRGLARSASRQKLRQNKLVWGILVFE